MGWVFNDQGSMQWVDDAPPPAAPTGPNITGGFGTGTGTGNTPGNPWAPGAPGPGGGKPIQVGVPPGRQQQWSHNGPMLPGFNDTGIDFEEVRRLLEGQKQEVKDIFGGQLGIGTGQFGLLGQTLANMLNNPQGFNPKDMALARTRISEREAGLRGTALQNMGVSKLGPRVADSALRESIRGQSGQRITDAELALDFQDQQMKQQNILAAIQAALGTAGISAGLTGQLGQIMASAFNPLAAGTPTNQGGPGSSQLPNERGLKENRLPGESLADQLRREAAAWQAFYGGASTPHGG